MNIIEQLTSVNDNMDKDKYFISQNYAKNRQPLKCNENIIFKNYIKNDKGIKCNNKFEKCDDSYIIPSNLITTKFNNVVNKIITEPFDDINLLNSEI